MSFKFPSSQAVTPLSVVAALTLATLLITPLLPVRSKQDLPRSQLVKPNVERVLILGASSGCGEELVYRYAKAGAKV